MIELSRGFPAPSVRQPLQALVAVPGAVAVIDWVVAGAIAGVAGSGLDLGTGASIAVGTAGFAVALVAFLAFGLRTLARFRSARPVRFPTPAGGEQAG